MVKKDKMAGSNTEKPMGKDEAKKQAVVKTPENKKVETAPVKKKEEAKKEDKKPVEKTEKAKEENKQETVNKDKTENKKEEKKVEIKKIKKTQVFVNVKNIPVSTKVAVAICKFINKKTIENAIKDLEDVSKLKKAVPMKGEIPHRKGRIMSGRFPIKAAKEFIVLLKSLQGNAIQHDVEEPIINEAIANKGMGVYGRAGRMKKRSNVKIICKEKKLIKQKKKKE